MIGNDVVDLDLAQKESNWKRKGFLEKLYKIREREFILDSPYPEITVWDLWSRKEAAYKVYNRETGVRAFNPLSFECLFENPCSGIVTGHGKDYHTSTIIDSKSIHTVAVIDEQNFRRITYLVDESSIRKINGIPFLGRKPISISEHGRFRYVVALIDL